MVYCVASILGLNFYKNGLLFAQQCSSGEVGFIRVLLWSISTRLFHAVSTLQSSQKHFETKNVEPGFLARGDKNRQDNRVDFHCYNIYSTVNPPASWFLQTTLAAIRMATTSAKPIARVPAQSPIHRIIHMILWLQKSRHQNSWLHPSVCSQKDIPRDKIASRPKQGNKAV